MLENDRWLLPEGIEELLPPEAARLESLRRRLLDMYHRWGYELVMPPFIEYLDSLLTGTGNDLDLQTFKLTDQLTGRLMGVRADMTPQVARIDAHHLKRDVPSRLCYLGTVLHTRPETLGGTRSPLQMGLELYGHAGIESDLEVLRLMIETLTVAGVENIHLDLGHVGIFRGLARQAKLSDDQEAWLFNALQRKAKPEIRDYLAELDISAELGEMLNSLADLNGGEAVLVEAKTSLAVASSEVTAALAYLQQLAVAVREQLPQLRLHFDLAELRGYHYHTGVVFAAFVPDEGQALAVGGRYDDIGKVFGRARPATGFSTDLKTLLNVTPGPVKSSVGIFAPADKDSGLEAKISELRAQGERVVRALPDQQGGAAEMGCDRELVSSRGNWKLVER